MLQLTMSKLKAIAAGDLSMLEDGVGGGAELSAEQMKSLFRLNVDLSDVRYMTETVTTINDKTEGYSRHRAHALKLTHDRTSNLLCPLD